MGAVFSHYGAWASAAAAFDHVFSLSSLPHHRVMLGSMVGSKTSQVFIKQLNTGEYLGDLNVGNKYSTVWVHNYGDDYNILGSWDYGCLLCCS
jgi:hypothetical protein